jgi:ubiquinone/menaquinone biosynthesis C-methylase UbiE
MSDRQARTYFDLLADLGLTKHYGSLDATRELIDLCQITREKLVLDVGCGVGATPTLLAKTIGCRVVGLDLIEKMLPQARERTEKNRVGGLVSFLAADARQLPFPDQVFDAVIMESVNVFFEDKLPAMAEYLRITKPGGFVGITEMTWLQKPDQELTDLFKRSAFVTALDEGAWLKLFIDSGLINVTGQGYAIDVSRESKGRLKRYGRMDVIKIIFRTLKLVLFSKEHRLLFRDGTSGLSRDVFKSVGYGVYAGQKELRT